jgi:hypothetical protein
LICRALQQVGLLWGADSPGGSNAFVIPDAALKVGHGAGVNFAVFREMLLSIGYPKKKEA